MGIELQIKDVQAVWTMAHHEADTGAPGGMVAVYVELALRHLLADHIGPWSSCGTCHDALGSDTCLHDVGRKP